MSKYVCHNQAVWFSKLVIIWGIVGLPAYYFLMRSFIDDHVSVFEHAKLCFFFMQMFLAVILLICLNDCYEDDKKPENERKKVKPIRKLIIKPPVKKVIIRD